MTVAADGPRVEGTVVEYHDKRTKLHTVTETIKNRKVTFEYHTAESLCGALQVRSTPSSKCGKNDPHHAIKSGKGDPLHAIKSGKGDPLHAKKCVNKHVDSTRAALIAAGFVISEQSSRTHICRDPN